MIEYLLSFALGFAVKTVDSSVEHGLKLKPALRYFLAIIYGALLAYLINLVFLPEFFLGILIGVIIAGKIDSKEHFSAVISFVLFSFFLETVIINWVIVAVAAMLCYFEEWVNDNIVDKKKVKGMLLKFLSVRPVLELAAIALSVIYSNISIFLLLLFFDFGYLSSKNCLK